METPTVRHRLATFARRSVRSLLNGRIAGRLFCALALVTALALPAVQAQTPTGTGSITGRVSNVGNGKYLANAVVTIVGTNHETLTNDFGEFRLNDVTAGEVKLSVASAGLDAEVATVVVVAGQTITRDFDLTSAERYGENKTLVLDTFVVAANREFEGKAIATNEQRFASGLKVVMAADAFGDVTEGNAGEFLKFLPGVTVDYVAADVRTVSVRGFAANFTNVYLDGMPITSANSGAAGRQFEFEQLSINNAARVEVLKVPTPSMPANGIGGNVNMVSKSSFERKGAQFNYRAYLSLNNEDLNLQKTPGPRSEDSYKVLPGFDFDYTMPITKNFGIVITGLSSSQFNEQHRWQTAQNYVAAGATVANPYLQTAQLQDGPKFSDRMSGSIKADWRISDNQRLSVMAQNSYYKSFFGNRNLNFDIGTTATTAAAGGTVLQWSPTFSQSATGTFSASDPYGNRGRVTQGSSFRDKLGNTTAANVRYSYTGSEWALEAGLHAAESRSWYSILNKGHFANVGTRMVGVANLRVENIDFPYHNFTARDALGNVIDPNNLANYRLTTATDDPLHGTAKMQGGYADVKRDFDFGKMPVTIKAGARIYEESKDNIRPTRSFTYVGADGVANTADDSAAPYADTNYVGQDPYWGKQPIQWINAYKLAEAYRSNPGYFTENKVTSEQFRMNNSEKIVEKISAGYVQFEGKLLNNRLQFITGVRYEKTNDKGEGVLKLGNEAIFEHNADGSLVDGNPALAGVQYVRKAAAGAAGATTTTTTGVPSGTVGGPTTYTNLTLQELALTTFERGYKASRSYDDYYPSLNVTYNITPQLLVRLGYAKTMGRPDYANIIPNTTIDEIDLDSTQPGTITVRNTGLKPWSADNYDLSLEYYFKKGGYLSGGVFQKEITDFFATRSGTVNAALAQELGIDDRFVGWGVSTTINGAGTAKIQGVEFSADRQLDFLPGYLRYISVAANATKLQLDGPEATAFANFIKETGNFAVSWNKKPLSAKILWNYRGRQLRSAQTGAQYNTIVNNVVTVDNGFYEYYKARVNVDVNFEYTLTKKFRLFANARNILNAPQILQRYSDASAKHAVNYQQEEFGVQMAVGLKGTF